MTNSNGKISVYDAWKILLGVTGALAGVAAIVVLLAILIRYALVHPTIAGGLSDDERYALLAKARAEDEKLLTTYGWMDKGKGIVRLPIDAAMQKLTEENAR